MRDIASVRPTPKINKRMDDDDERYDGASQSQMNLSHKIVEVFCACLTDLIG
jgi:hypothetical protein